MLRLAFKTPVEKIGSLGVKCTSIHSFSTCRAIRLEDRGLHQKANLSKEEKIEMKLFHKNQKKLEKMETKKSHANERKPDMETLKKFGDDARIEQNRPDDGVY